MTAAAVPTPAREGGGALPVPDHVAIIMDGNGRWARGRGFPRSVGHERGVEALRRTVTAAADMGVTSLTVFSFSTENWSRPLAEVNALFALLRAYVKRDLAKLHREGTRIRVIGSREGLPDDILKLIDEAETVTQDNTTFNLTIAFNYGSRAEIAEAARQLATDAVAGRIRPEEIDEGLFGSRLLTPDLPDPDLLIRTSGECRISNFLLWQLAYAELVFMPVLWPDFGADHLAEALETYARRERRFGAVSAAGE